MPYKKHHAQSKAKKAAPAPTQQADHELVQHLLEQYRQIAQALHSSKNNSEVETALAPIHSLPEATQIAFLKALAKEITVEAADVLTAMYTADTVKEARKQARRSLIQLEQARIYPKWEPPKEPVSLEGLLDLLADPPHFWKGWITDTKASGEIQLILCWEQGARRQEVRMLGFLLEFWHDGVKDFFMHTGSKQLVENRIAEMRAQLSDVKLVDCTLAEGRQLLEEALATNKRFGTAISRDYTRNLSTIQQLIFTPEDDEDLDDEDMGSLPPGIRSIPDLLQSLLAGVSDAEEAAAGFMQQWTEKDYSEAYDLLADNSPIREGLARDEWAARRTQWRSQAGLDNVKPLFITERESDSANGRTMVDIGWSATMTDTPIEGTPREMPAATAIFRETGRHWFWVCCTLIDIGNETWRVYDVTDEGANVFRLPTRELQQQITATIDLLNARMQEIARTEELLNEDEDEDDFEEDEDKDLDALEKGIVSLVEGIQDTIYLAAKTAYYSDALIARPKANATTYIQAKQLAIGAEDGERVAMFMQTMAERLPKERIYALQELSVAFLKLGQTYEENDDEEQANHFRARAEQTLRECVMLAPRDAAPYIALGNIIASEDKDLAEAEKLLHQAQPLARTPLDQARIEHDLGVIAQKRDEIELALQHFQRAVAIRPDYTHNWYHIGEIQHQLGQIEEAEQSLQRCIEGDDTEVEAYTELAVLYANKGDLEAASEILSDGLDANPDAADLAASLALIYIRMGDLYSASEYLVQAEELDPELDLVQTARVQYNAAWKEQSRSKHKSKRHKAKKKR